MGEGEWGRIFFFFFVYEVVDDWKERKLTSQWSAEVLHEDTLSKWTYLRAVVLIGAWTTRSSC